MIKRFWRWLKRAIRTLAQRLFGKKRVVASQKPVRQEPVRKLLTDVEYESLFLQLLAGVNDESWSRGRIQGFLAGKNVAEEDLVGWLRGFGERLLAGDGENRELAARMVRLGEVGCGGLGEVAEEIGRGLLGKCTGEETSEEKGEAEVCFQRGFQQFEVGDFENSIESYDEALKLTSDDHQAWFNRGLALANLGRLEEAIASWRKVLKLKPDDYKAWYNISEGLAHLKRFEEAINTCDEALKIKLDFHLAWHNRGSYLRSLGRFEEGIAACDEALKIKPMSYLTWYNRGLLLSDLKRFEEAFISFENTLNIKPDFHEGFYNRGFVLFKQGKFEEAIVAYEQALNIQPNYHEAWHHKGTALDALQRFQEGILSYDQALKLQADDYEVWYNRGVALNNLGNLEEAIASFNKAIKFKPEYHQAWQNLGTALYNLQYHEEALASLEQAIKFEPNDYQSWSNQGAVLNDLGRVEEAIASYDKALNMKPDYHSALNGKGALFSNTLNQHEEAIVFFDRAIEIKPDNYLAWYNRGIAAGKSISVNPLPTSSSAIARQNPNLNKRDYDGALVSFQEGLKYCQQDTHPEGWGMLHQAIGKTHYSQGVGEHHYRQYWLQAEAEYKQALITLTPEAFPELHLDLLRNLIRVLFGLNKDEAAKEYRKQALAVFGQLLNSPDKSSFQKRQLEAKFSGFSQMRVDVLIEDGDFISALETAERNKNFYLTWILDARKEHILSPSYSQIQKLINPQTHPNTAIIYWHISPFAITTFIIKPDTNKPIVIPTEKPEKIETWLKNWQTQYENHKKGAKQESSNQSSNPDWRYNLPQLLTQLSEILNISAILETIPNQNTQIQNLILIPHRDLHRLPLHTLFPDDFTTTYLPSAQIGINLQQKLAIPTPSNLLSIEAPNSTDADNKPFDQIRHAELESATICAIFPNPQRLPGNEASKENMTAALLAENHQILHFTGHATYNYQRPKLSCLALSGTDRFTLEDITQLSLENNSLENYHLVSLSACETAITGNQTIDNEYVGLVSAFLSQGVTNVLSTLWTVESVSSALFMIEFYRQPDWHTTPAVALKRTQMWLRNVTYPELVNWYKQLAEEIAEKSKDKYNICSEALRDEAAIIENEIANNPDKINTTTPPYSHPYYWASFIITGKTHT